LRQKSNGFISKSKKKKKQPGGYGSMKKYIGIHENTTKQNKSDEKRRMF